jgi:hypothetical protein
VSGGLYEFSRSAVRRSRYRRHLDCGCVIDHGELYSYFVAKVRHVAGLQQIYLCRWCG